MSKGIQNFLQKHKKLLLVHLVSIGVLSLEFVLCRYVFFGLHGMKEWPCDLFVIGMVALLISLFARKQYAPWFTSISYFVWFWLGKIFNKVTIDSHGTRESSMPIIWIFGFLAFILIGFLFEIALKWWRLLKNRK